MVSIVFDNALFKLIAVDKLQKLSENIFTCIHSLLLKKAELRINSNQKNQRTR
ncbi:hypothetical protein SAMN05444483_105124 [Salegentibacter echinorum]|uniref:Uncharacterized protein n=1 Tax=Salegentibacter echinorum TaxID=1073325 RepID=A0A1M5HF37_SALEC|nr:hypothetical protein SAMN05444483_105124 [Salegentibacter echinorum]